MHSSVVKLKKPEKTNPFHPTSGAAPPHLAGRKEDLNVFQDCLDCMADPQNDANGPMVLLGPRGNGKTALMLRMASTAAVQGAQVVKLEISELKTPEKLAKHLTALANQSKSIQTSETRLVGGTAGVPGLAAAEGSVETHREHLEPSLTRALGALGRKPCLILIDEAHTLPLDTGRELLNAEQSARAGGANIQLILAGTPNLQDALSDMNATFWSRLDNRRRPLGLLPRADSLDAIAKPMRTSITDEAADLIMKETDGYPYFLQIMGRSLWDSGHPSRKPITADAVRQATPDFTRSKSGYYIDRLNDLERSDLLMAACAVTETAQAQGGFAVLTNSDIEAACERAGARSHKAVKKLFEGLVHAGFLWADEQSKDQMDPFAVPPWSCGIPTLSQAASRRVRALWPDAHPKLLPPERRAEASREQAAPHSTVDANATVDQDADGLKKP